MTKLIVTERYSFQIQKNKKQFAMRTAPSASTPPPICSWIANSITRFIEFVKREFLEILKKYAIKAIANE